MRVVHEKIAPQKPVMTTGDLAIRPGERPREVEPAAMQLVKVGHEVEVEVQDGAVVLARGDQERGLAGEEEVAGVLGVGGDRSRRGD